MAGASATAGQRGERALARDLDTAASAVRSSIRWAWMMRWRASQAAGVAPYSALNRRAKVRGDMRARAAS